ncbi:MAG: hypothetical protein U0T74_14940 [Chitinophagales bacterium]
MSRYTKAQLEEFFYRQYEYIESLNERIQLLQEQNVIYRALNKKLTEEQLHQPEQKIYGNKGRKKGGSKNKDVTIKSDANGARPSSLKTKV